MKLPAEFAWLETSNPPSMLAMALSLYGTAEVKGPGNNPSILQWARSIGLGKVYRNDATAWCGLTVAYVAHQTRWTAGMPTNPLSARNWLIWGDAVDRPMFGDLLVFWRGRKTGWNGHVGWYIGEDATHFCVLGGNQGDCVSIKWIPKARLLGARRCHWRIAQPASVRRVMLRRNGALSTSEA